MSLQFNDTSTFCGIVQIYEKECGFNPGDISGNTNKLKEFTADANLAHDDLLRIGFKKGGTWNVDDTNFSDDYPILYANLTSGRREYAFTSDETGNLILDIHRIMLADPSGVYRDLEARNIQERNSVNNDTTPFVDGRNATGMPTGYDKTGNGILFDLVPNYSYTRGIKLFVNREGSYFSYLDTTKVPGVHGSLHRWYAIKPAADYARRKGKKNAASLALEVAKLEIIIGEVFSMRQKDVKGNISPAIDDCQ